MSAEIIHGDALEVLRGMEAESFDAMVTDPPAGIAFMGKAWDRDKGGRRDRGEGNAHATVKPTALMRWLCRLITPTGGIVLDPFAGSGTTGVAALQEGMRLIGIEQDAESVRTARRRLRAAAPAPARRPRRPAAVEEAA